MGRLGVHINNTWFMSHKIISITSSHVFQQPVVSDLDQTQPSVLCLARFHLCVVFLLTLMCVFAWPAQRDELREIFNDISSSSEDEEDEGDRHEDEDLNIMDTEDDLVRQLQDKLNESDSAQHESDRNNQIGESLDRKNLFGFSSAGWTKKK